MITVPYVDEDPIMCSLVSRIFEKTGDIVVHSSVSGEEALAWAFTHHADVIVSDNGLPGHQRNGPVESPCCRWNLRSVRRFHPARYRIPENHCEDPRRVQVQRQGRNGRKTDPEASAVCLLGNRKP